MPLPDVSQASQAWWYYDNSGTGIVHLVAGHRGGEKQRVKDCIFDPTCACSVFSLVLCPNDEPDCHLTGTVGQTGVKQVRTSRQQFMRYVSSCST